MDFQKVTNFLGTLGDIGIPGVDLGVYIKGEEVYRHRTGYADLDKRTLIAPDTLFPIYSMTKVITCVCALRLFEEGVFKLGDPLYDYLPEFKQMNVRSVSESGDVHLAAAENPIRIVDLFTMCSGFSYDMTPEVQKLWDNPGGNFTLKDFSEAIAKDPLYFEPGTYFQYGFSHDVLGRLIEVLSGKTLGDYFSDNIFIPLEMSDTFFRLPKEKESRIVTFYDYDDEKKTHTKKENLPIRFDLDFKFESGGGGLISTVDDYARFANALCAGGTAVNGYRVLGNATIELMRTDHLGKNGFLEYGWNHYSGYSYGLGVRTMIDKAVGGSNSSIGEYGWAGMAGTYVSIDPTVDLVYVYAQQLFPSKEDYIAHRLRNVIYGCL